MCRANTTGASRGRSMTPSIINMTEIIVARKYSKAASAKVKKVMHERKEGTLKSGGSGKTVKSKKQAIAIGLSEARKAGKKVPKKKTAKSS
jgi:hypothetical protein